jgi:hypothetical protein
MLDTLAASNSGQANLRRVEVGDLTLAYRELGAPGEIGRLLAAFFAGED